MNAHEYVLKLLGTGRCQGEVYLKNTFRPDLYKVLETSEKSIRCKSPRGNGNAHVHNTTESKVTSVQVIRKITGSKLILILGSG